MKQTPIDWLVEKLNQCEPWYSGTNVPKDHIDYLIHTAKRLEKLNNDWHYIRGRESLLKELKRDTNQVIQDIEIRLDS